MGGWPLAGRADSTRQQQQYRPNHWAQRHRHQTHTIYSTRQQQQYRPNHWAERHHHQTHSICSTRQRKKHSYPE